MNSGGLPLKTQDECKIMREGGLRLARVKDALENKIDKGVTAFDLEVLANDLIKKEGGTPSFKMVPGYAWATCININAGLVHGIPKPEIVFGKGDVVSVDVGMYFRGFHTDTSFTVGIETDKDIQNFLEVGRRALREAISQAKIGRHVYNISEAIQKTVEAGGFSPVRALVGHGVGRKLHEEPQIPCFVPGRITDSPQIAEGMVLAIEVMYAWGAPEVKIGQDGWTISTRDDKISALFEETVEVTKEGPKVLTARQPFFR